MQDDRISQWLRPAVTQMSAYSVADATGKIKLDAMENPYTLPDDLRAEWAAQLQRLDVNRYPDPGARALKSIMREQLSLPGEYGLVLGNGSDEIIQMLALALGGEGRAFMSVEPAFVMYRLIAMMNGLDYISVDLGATDFSLDMDATLSMIASRQPAVVFVANPNNPTGNIHQLDALRQIADAVPGILVIDEAYEPFTDITALPLLQEYDHVMIMRTLSKMGLAGLRLGYLVGHPGWTEQLEKVRLPYNINVMTQHAARFALRHLPVFQDQARQIRTDRQAMLAALDAMQNIDVWPSEANFLLFRVPAGRGRDIFDRLNQQGVLIKSLAGGHHHLQDCLRVTIGNHEENKRFIAALEVALAADH